jgi:hypothetical protein
MAFIGSGTPTGGWSFTRRLVSVLLLGTSVVLGSTTPIFAAPRGGGARGGAYRGGSQSVRSTPPASRPAPPANHSTTAPANRSTTPPSHSGRTGNVNTTTNRNVNVNQSRTVNVHNDVHVHHNTAVRAAPRPYARAPYVHGGHRYYAHNTYVYRRYTPYVAWGPAFRPFGAVVATMAATAVVVSIANASYYYNAGVWYLPASSGYTVVTAPVGAVVTTLPPAAVVVDPNVYYYGGAYYEQTGSEYKVVPPTAGTVVEHLPEGGEEVTVGDKKYVKFGDTYYQPIEKDGKPAYEVVEVK